ncbi:MAG: recombination protein RecR [Deltaproteobacteria bacterium]|nr:recombination protein RecR [Deltaproteobacteria bacterium]
MAYYVEPIKRLVEEFSRLPGVGEKTASRLAFHILNTPREYAEALAKSLLEVKEKVKNCSICFNLSDRDPCSICEDGDRVGDLICVVEGVKELMAIEGMGGFKGRYHVLHGLISPLNGVCPDDIRIKELLKRLDGGKVKEVILAISPNLDGEATILYITKLLKPLGVRVTRIATGVPVGGDLEYMDGATIGKALEGRREV